MKHSILITKMWKLKLKEIKLINVGRSINSKLVLLATTLKQLDNLKKSVSSSKLMLNIILYSALIALILKSKQHIS